MPNEVTVQYPPSNTLYCVLINKRMLSSGTANVDYNKFRDVVADAWDVFTVADWADYTFSLTESGGAGASGVYQASLPAPLTLADGPFEAWIYVGANDSPLLDTFVASLGVGENPESLDTIPELGVAKPTATPTIRTAIMLLYMIARNELTLTDPTGGGVKSVKNDAGTVIATKALTDDGTTYTEAEMASG